MMPDNNVIDLPTWKGKLQQSAKGPKKTMTNLLVCLQGIRELGANIRWNELAQRPEWNRQPLTDTDLVRIRVILEANGFEPPVNDVLPAVMAHARDNAYHPVRDYLKGLKWDGSKRLNYWLVSCLGADDNPFTHAVGRKTLIAAVARAFNPGCKVDTVLVLEGPQGIRKSTAIAALFGEEYTAESVNLFDQHNKMVMAMMGAWCVELAEFIAIAKKDQNTVKGMLSMRSDRVVLPYAKMASDHPRQCVFFGTINPGEGGYLTDSTGNRRYWPIAVTQANVERIRKWRDQIWAEAYAAFMNDEPWWLTPEEERLAAVQVEVREEYDVWEEILHVKLIQEGVTITSAAGALNAIGVPNERMGKRELDRVGKCLRRIGYQRDENASKVSGEDGKRRSVKLFRRPE